MSIVLLACPGCARPASVDDESIRTVRAFAETAAFRLRIEIAYISPLAGRAIKRSSIGTAAHLHVTMSGVFWSKPLVQLVEILKQRELVQPEEDPIGWASEIKVSDIQTGKNLLTVQMSSLTDLAIVNGQPIIITKELRQWHMDYLYPIVQATNRGAPITQF